MKRICYLGIYALLFVFLLSSCNSTFNKPLSEFLTEEEESTLNENQAHCYKLLKRYITMHAIAGSPQLAQLEEISYNELFKYMETIKTKSPQWTEEAKEYWEKEYSQTTENVLACYDNWLKWEKENSLASKVKVELVSIENIGFPTTFILSFKSKVGPIKSIYCDFGFGKTTDHNFYESYPESKLTSEDIITIKSYNSVPDDFKKLPLQEALKKHNFCYEITSIKVADTTGNIKLYLGSDHLKEIPGPVLSAMSKAKHGKLTDLEYTTFHEEIKNIATKVLNLDYTTPQDYLDNYCYSKCEELDEKISKLHRSLVYLSNN